MPSFNELLLDVSSRLNLTSDEARARVFREINMRHRRATSSVGLAPTRRGTRSVNATIDNRNVIFGLEKIEAVMYPRNPGAVDNQPDVLDEITRDEMITEPIKGEPPTKYAIDTTGPISTTIIINAIPQTTFELQAIGLTTAETLAGVADSPDFPESYHDILVWGALADEYRKMDKHGPAREMEFEYKRRLSELRMFIAKSAYLEIYQNKLNEDRRHHPLNRLHFGVHG